MYFIPKP